MGIGEWFDLWIMFFFNGGVGLFGIIGGGYYCWRFGIILMIGGGNL